MSSVYEAVGTNSAGPQRVNFGWVNESWSLFKASSGLWMASVVLGVFGPVLFNAFIAVLFRLTNHIAGQGSLSVASMISPRWLLHAYLHLPSGLLLGLGILTTIYAAFIAAGMARMAVKQVAGKSLVFGDIYSGAPLFGKMLVYGMLYSIIVTIGIGLLIIPGLFLAGLLLPSFALIARGDGISKAVKGSFTAMKPDRAGAAGFVFVIGMLTIVSALPLGIGLLATAPMFWLLSAIAARDMVRLPALDAAADPYYNPLDNNSWAGSEAIPGQFGYSQGTETLAASGGADAKPRLSLSGAPLDENGNEVTPPSVS